MIPDRLHHTLRQLRLSGLRQTLDVRVQEAAANQLSHLEFLELILQDEQLIRHQRQLRRRTQAARFRDQRTLDDFDFTFNPGVDRRLIFELATGQFVRDHRDVLLLGPPGTGKSHLAQALGLAAIHQGFTVFYRSIFDLAQDFQTDEAARGQAQTRHAYLGAELLIIDDLGMKELPRAAGEQLFEVIMRRHGLRATIMTSNRPVEDWGKLLGDHTTASAILDRFLAAAEVITLAGRSYRLKDRACKRDDPK